MTFDLNQCINNILQMNISLIPQSVDNILNYCSQLQKNILKSDKNMIGKYVLLHVNILNYVYRIISLFCLISSDNSIHKENNKIERYIKEFYLQSKICDTLQKFAQYITDKNEKYIIIKILTKYNDNKNVVLRQKIENNVSSLRKKINKYNVINTYPHLQEHIPNIPNELLLDKNAYLLLQREITDSTIRNDVSIQYCNKSDEIYELMGELIITRTMYAKIMNFDTYFNFINKDVSEQSNDVKEMINIIVEKCNNKTQKEIKNIKHILNISTDKIYLTDFTNRIETLKNKHLFSLSNTLNVIFNILLQKFNIKITKYKTDKIWNTNINTFNVYINDIFQGYLYLDLLQRKNKNINSPLAILLRNNFYYEDTELFSLTTIIANYQDYNTKSLSYSDVVILFKEFGNAIQLLCSSFIVNETYKANEFSLIMSYIMEHIAWEEETIKCFFDNDKKRITYIIKDIIKIRTTNFAIILKEKCLNAFFDHIVHNSLDFYNVLKNYDILYEKNHPIKALYTRCFSYIMNSDNNIYSDNISINTNLLNQEINSGGMLYNNVLLEILSFSAYKKIYNGNKTFVTNIIMADGLKEAFSEFINESYIDPYDIFVKHFL
jgi:Zn-dependent oligopeptidase